jgi:hypothetical protein
VQAEPGSRTVSCCAELAELVTCGGHCGNAAYVHWHRCWYGHLQDMAVPCAAVVYPMCCVGVRLPSSHLYWNLRAVCLSTQCRTWLYPAVPPLREYQSCIQLICLSVCGCPAPTFIRVCSLSVCQLCAGHVCNSQIRRRASTSRVFNVLCRCASAWLSLTTKYCACACQPYAGHGCTPRYRRRASTSSASRGRPRCTTRWPACPQAWARRSSLLW